MGRGLVLVSKRFTKHHYLSVMVFGALGTLVGALLMTVFLSYSQSSETHNGSPEDTIGATSTILAMDRSAPVRLTIPKIKVDTTFEAPLGLKADLTVEVPDSYTQVGWYKNGPTPGEIGPAVILGHVDSYEGPAVFWPLQKLEAGDEIEIAREDGSVVRFKVDSIARYSQADFPTALVYGPTESAQLRLITCTGIYNRNELRYTHNIVVYASLVE